MTGEGRIRPNVCTRHHDCRGSAASASGRTLRHQMIEPNEMVDNAPFKATGRKRKKAKNAHFHHVVYVVYLRNPKGDGKAGTYVGMTGLTPEQRFANHKAGIKAASVVRKYGERLVPVLYEHLNPMRYDDAL